MVNIVSEGRVNSSERELRISGDHFVGRFPLPLMEHVDIPHADASAGNAWLAAALSWNTFNVSGRYWFHIDTIPRRKHIAE